MAEVIELSTERFDPARETSNPINPIAGEALLAWLAVEIRTHGFEPTDPEPEDWGWYMDVSAGETSYLVGASGEAGEGTVVRWVIQIHRHRTLWQRLRGAARLAPDDPLVAAVVEVLRAQPDFANVERSRD